MDITKLNETALKNFWIINNPTLANNKITGEEWSKLKAREITNEEIKKLKLERITEEELSLYTDYDKKAAYIYSLMNEGYYYDKKILKRGEEISEEEYAYISENLTKLKGINTELDWERTYPYGSTFKTILGTVSSSSSGIPYELKDYYLKKGYSLNDRVGISYLEYQYEEYLRGKKSIYELANNGSMKLVEEGIRGNDIVLTIDIELQKAVE